MELDAQEKNERKVELISEKEVALVADEEKNGRTVESASGKENKNHVKLAAEEERKREVKLNFEEGSKCIVELAVQVEKGSPGVVPPLSVGVGRGWIYMYRAFPLYFAKRLFPRFEPMIWRPKKQLNHCIKVYPPDEVEKETKNISSGEKGKSEVELGADKRNESEVKVAGEEENKRKIKLVTEENQILVTLYTAEEIISKVELSAKNKNESKSELVADVESESKTKWVKHYNSRHKILLVGEGDFSFAACLGRAFGSAANIVATSLDSQELLVIKHRNASANLRSLRELGCTILHEVNALSMRTHPVLSFRSFDRIVFNFPHAGFYGREHDSFQIELHKNLVRGYLQNAHGMVSEKGEIHVTHKTTYPFSCWKIKELAAGCGLKLIEEVRFTKWDYPGYENKRGHGVRSDESFPVGQCSTYKFTKK